MEHVSSELLGMARTQPRATRLGSFEQKVLVACTEALLPAGGAIPRSGIEARVVPYVEQMVSRVPRMLRLLVRALLPIEGVELMRRRRAPDRRSTNPIPEHELCRGPGSLARAMGITLADNRADLCGRRLWLEDRGIVYKDVAWSSRIGISAGVEHPWRGFVIGCPAVSGQPRTSASRPAVRRGASGRPGRRRSGRG